tara:strand:+ start:1004 stop:1393 length:390 start_codon:yes stop_codon:yes gene_type:complete
MDAEDAVDPDTRRRLFWAVCVPVRVGLATGALVIGARAPQLLLYVGIYAALTAAAFAVNAMRAHAGGKRTGGLGGAVWWARMRYVHVVLWAACAALALRRVRWAGAVLAVDAFAGAAAGALHYRRGMCR